jgi:hypothetical protein
MYTEPREVKIHKCDGCGQPAHPCYGHRCENCYAGVQPRTRADRDLRPTHASAPQPTSTRMFVPEL